MNRRRGVGDDSSDEEEPSATAQGNGAPSKLDDSGSSRAGQPKSSSAERQSNDDANNGEEEDGDHGSSEGEGDRASDDERDSSEESSDDENEDEIAKVREGFIVDDDDDDDDDDNEGSKPARRRKRRRQAKEEGIQLDEDDLDLLGIAPNGGNGATGPGGADSEAGGRFKRLKKASKAPQRKKGLDSIFDDDVEDEDEDAEDEDRERESRNRGSGSRSREFDDFIEADEFSEDEEEALRREEEREIGRRRRENKGQGVARPGLSAVGDLVGLDEEKLSEIYDVFGDGEMYDWALANEDEEALDGTAHPPEDEQLQLTDVFEPSELAARMLTAEDNQIRSEDLPERFQILRQKLQHSYDLSDDAEYFEKKQWIADALLKIKMPNPEFRELTRQAINQVVDCVSRDNLEVPFIWHHRQDYLVHFTSTASDAERTQLLTLDDLWRILDLDLDFHALIERRRALHRLESQVDFSKVPESASDSARTKLTSFTSEASTGVEYQDLVDYVQFIASAQLRAARRHSRFAAFDRIRQGSTMELVDALGLNIDRIAEELVSVSSANAPSSALPSRQEITDPSRRDPALTPSELITEIGPSASLDDAVSYLGHSLSYDPRVRRFFRQQFDNETRIDLILTDDGRRKITVNSPFADLKYSYNWTLEELRKRPALFLRMLRAENQGLLIVRAQYPHYKTSLYSDFERLVAGGETDAGSDGAASEWVEARRSVAKTASRIIVPLIARNIRESLRAECVRILRYEVRSAFSARLNQAPYKPPGYVLGTVPRALCISAGEGGQTDAVLGAVVDEDGHVSEVFKLGDMRGAGFKETLIQNVKDAKPDVVGVAGFTPAARRLYEAVRSTIVDTAQMMAGPEDAEQPLAVVWVQDEVARLYRHSERAAVEFPDLVPNARYCVSLARYLQNPLLEYVQLDASQLRNLVLHKDQALLPDDEFSWAIESAFVDTVCVEGVDLNQAVRSNYHAAALPYVSGLGPRKAGGIIQSVLSRTKGGRISTRTQLVTSEITSRIIFMNCASFLRIPWSPSSSDYSSSTDEAEYLDATRIHPEDYELARKMCADALELDEEDVEAVEERQLGGVVGMLLTEDSEGKKLDELVLEEYAEELEQLFKQKKRITLEQIRREIQDAYGEMRAPLRALTADEVFTMLTGETRESYSIGNVVSSTVRRVTGRQLILTLSGGIDGVAEAGSISDDRSVPLAQQFAPGQAVQAELVSVDYGALYALVNTRHSAVVDAVRKQEQKLASNRDPQHWDAAAERRDNEAAHRRSEQRQRQLRVIKHPLFRPFSAKEAEAYLAPLQRGDLVIRPSSLGMDHLVVTWKVSDQIYQHIDVKELDKPNEYAVGATLEIGPYRYTDLDELIIMHVQSMARKVDEMCASDKFQKGNRGDVEKWLSAYTNARPTQSVYAFCFDHRRPGYFLLCYMLGANQPIKELHVKVLPNGYGLLRNAYTDVQSLTNGFKMMVQRSRV